jgi:hypothetical protein
MTGIFSDIYDVTGIFSDTYGSLVRDEALMRH